MPVQFVAIVVIPGPEFKRTAAALGRADRDMPRDFSRDIRENAERLASQARARVRRMPVRGRAGSTGLRARVAAGVDVRPTSNGARVTTSMAQRDEQIIPRGLDRASGWRHPVFGNRSVWVRQTPSRPGWFSDTMNDGRDDIERDLTDSIERARDDIAGAG